MANLIANPEERVRPGMVWVKPTTFVRAGKTITRRGYWRRKPRYVFTPARRRAIEIARRRWMAMTPKERAEAMPGGEI
ncbi:MAG: hypothetical protein AB1485_06370 [Candidatus Thermoplasmatota archaeon]